MKFEATSANCLLGAMHVTLHELMMLEHNDIASLEKRMSALCNHLTVE